MTPGVQQEIGHPIWITSRMDAARWLSKDLETFSSHLYDLAVTKLVVGIRLTLDLQSEGLCLLRGGTV